MPSADKRCRNADKIPGASTIRRAGLPSNRRAISRRTRVASRDAWLMSVGQTSDALYSDKDAFVLLEAAGPRARRLARLSSRPARRSAALWAARAYR